MRPSRIAQRGAGRGGCCAAERARSNGTLARASACAVHRRDVALAEESFDLFLGAGPAGRTVRSRPTARSVYVSSKSKMLTTPACHERASKHPNVSMRASAANYWNSAHARLASPCVGQMELHACQLPAIHANVRLDSGTQSPVLHDASPLAAASSVHACVRVRLDLSCTHVPTLLSLSLHDLRIGASALLCCGTEWRRRLPGVARMRLLPHIYTPNGPRAPTRTQPTLLLLARTHPRMARAAPHGFS